MLEDRKGSRRHVPSTAITGFIDRGRIDALLAPWVPDPAGRAFVVRCMLDEGPAHHRGANYVLLSLLGLLIEQGGPAGSPSAADSVPVPIRVPAAQVEDPGRLAYPLPLRTRALEGLARNPRELEAMVDCLTDGPPQHALANAALVALIDLLLERAGR